jgi:hypothetical protein
LEYTQERARSAGLPIVSVSHKPIDLGMNIVVGDVGRSSINIHRQISIGCQHAKTKYVIWCEADSLYPPEHFKFIPPKDDRIYKNRNMWRLLVERKRFVKKKKPSVCVIVSSREHLLRIIKDMLKDQPQWVDMIEHKSKKSNYKLKQPQEYGCDYFETKAPVVSLFHKSGMHQRLSAVTGDKMRSVEYWPEAKEICKNLGV